MCANYQPVTREDRLLSFFGVVRGEGETPDELWPLGLAPFIRRAEDGSGNRVVDNGIFGLLPGFAKELAYGRKLYNARAETVAALPSFRDSWQAGRRCIIPTETIFEYCYDTSRAVRWAIQQPGAVPLGIAGVYRRWRDRWSFAMLTINADGHPVYGRMHKPGEEMRMVVILDPAEYDRWLFCAAEEAVSLFRQWTGPLDAFPAPLPGRGAQGKGDAPGLF